MQYPYKVLAFVKYVVNGNERIAYFILNPRTDLRNFVDYLLSPDPRNRKPDWSITPYNYKWTAFHVKVKGSREFTMSANPQYICSHSVKKGFFNKLGINQKVRV